jgi:hypothetical protein
MSRIIIIIGALAGIFAMPAQAFDATPSPDKVGPTFFKPAPLDLPPNLMSQANTGGTVGQGVDPIIGTWKLNVEKSTFIGIPVLKSETLTITADGPNFILTVETVGTQGATRKSTITHIHDGMPHSVVGNPNYDATSFTRMGNVISVARFKNGQQISVGQNVIVPGKTYTGTTGGINVTNNNQPFYSVQVYDRQ